jgi:hypothetical protein
MSDTFGDDDPEDSYDVGDPLPLRLRLIARILEHIATHDDDRAERRRDGVRELLAAIVEELDD